MWTWCREHDKTSLGIHERGSEFLATIGSFCQIWWGLHTAARWNDLLEGGFSFFSWMTSVCLYVGVHVCACLPYMCKSVCLNMGALVYILLLAGMRASWVHLEAVWDKLKLLGITWDSATCTAIYVHMYTFVCECVKVCGLQTFIYMCICY